MQTSPHISDFVSIELIYKVLNLSAYIVPNEGNQK